MKDFEYLLYSIHISKDSTPQNYDSFDDLPDLYCETCDEIVNDENQYCKCDRDNIKKNWVICSDEE